MTDTVQLIKLSQVHTDHQHLISPDMVSAKVDCRRCYGRGYTGWTQDGKGNMTGYEWCGCLVVNVNMLANKMAAAKAKYEQEKDNQPQPMQEAVDGAA